VPEFVFVPRKFASAKLIARRVATLFLCSFGVTALLVFLTSSRAYGDVGVILNESLDTSVEWVTGSGHTAVYFSRICPDSPVKLRLCHPGEEGSVMSNYINLGEDQKYEWNIAPLNVYVYGVLDPRHRPVFGSAKVKKVLEDRYRDQALSEYCTAKSCTTSDKAEWREMVGAGMSRSMYIFVVQTAVEQDLDIIAKFNALPNENHFNGVTRNCADFTKDVVNTYFPHAAHRDVLNDFGMTSPKAVARTFTHNALDHPESHFRVLHFSQLPGTIKQSTEARSGTEQLYHSKKLLIPMVIFASQELPVAAAAYLTTGRFNPGHEFEAHPAADATQIGDQIHVARSYNEDASPDQLEAIETQEREEVVGTPTEWKKYKKAFDTIVDEAVSEEIIPRRSYVTQFFKHLDQTGTPSADSGGSLWMTVQDGDEISKLGLSVDNIFAPESDPRLAFVLLLARIDHVLKSPKHSRETMLEFKADWALLQYAEKRIPAPGTKERYSAARHATTSSGRSD
jgi:hypothetical protein